MVDVALVTISVNLTL